MWRAWYCIQGKSPRPFCQLFTPAAMKRPITAQFISLISSSYSPKQARLHTGFFIWRKWWSDFRRSPLFIPPEPYVKHPTRTQPILLTFTMDAHEVLQSWKSIILSGNLFLHRWIWPGWPITARFILLTLTWWSIKNLTPCYLSPETQSLTFSGPLFKGPHELFLEFPIIAQSILLTCVMSCCRGIEVFATFSSE